MIDAEYFRTRLPADAGEKATEGMDQPIVEIYLTDGTLLRISSIVRIEDGWIVVEVYPEQLKEHREEVHASGAPRYKLDRVAVPYHAITRVLVTLRPVMKGKMGFAFNG